jgi:hypothetical protein
VAYARHLTFIVRSTPTEGEVQLTAVGAGRGAGGGMRRGSTARRVGCAWRKIRDSRFELILSPQRQTFSLRMRGALVNFIVGPNYSHN